MSTSRTDGSTAPGTDSSSPPADFEAVREVADSPSDISGLEGRRWIPQRVLEGCGAALILLLCGFVTVSVILRVTGGGGVGVVEIGSMAMVALTVLVIPAATGADANFRMEIVDFFVSQRSVRILDVVGLVVQLAVAVFMTVSVASLFVYDVTTRTTMGGELAWPRYWLTLVVTIGFLGMVHALVLRGVRMFQESANPKRAEEHTAEGS